MCTNQYILKVHRKEALLLLKSDAGVGVVGGGAWGVKGRRKASGWVGEMAHLLKCLPSRKI